MKPWGQPAGTTSLPPRPQRRWRRQRLHHCSQALEPLSHIGEPRLADIDIHALLVVVLLVVGVARHLAIGRLGRLQQTGRQAGSRARTVGCKCGAQPRCAEWASGTASFSWPRQRSSSSPTVSAAPRPPYPATCRLPPRPAPTQACPHPGQHSQAQQQQRPRTCSSSSSARSSRSLTARAPSLTTIRPLAPSMLALHTSTAAVSTSMPCSSGAEQQQHESRCSISLLCLSC